MKSMNLSQIFALLALLVFAFCIVGKLAWGMDIAVLVCAGGALIAAAVVVGKKE